MTFEEFKKELGEIINKDLSNINDMDTAFQICLDVVENGFDYSEYDVPPKNNGGNNAGQRNN